MSKVSDQVFVFTGEDGKQRLIQAKNIQSAFKFATGAALSIKPATAREVVSAMADGVVVEVANS